MRQTQYDYLYVLGAVCPDTGQSVGLLAPHLDTAIVNHFFEQFAQELDADVHAVLIWDQAGYHTAKALKVPPNVSLIALPPYSPELNPVENLWHYLRSHYWSNRCYCDYEDLTNAATHAWRHACLDAELIKTVCAAPYLARAAKLRDRYNLGASVVLVLPHFASFCRTQNSLEALKLCSLMRLREILADGS